MKLTDAQVDKMLSDMKNRTEKDRWGTEYGTKAQLVDLLKQSQVCPYCNEAFNVNNTDLFPSVDRLNANTFSNPYFFQGGKSNCQIAHLMCNLDYGWKPTLAAYLEREVIWKAKIEDLQIAIAKCPVTETNPVCVDKEIVDFHTVMKAKAQAAGVSLRYKRCRKCNQEKELYWFKPFTRQENIEFNIIFPTEIVNHCYECQAKMLNHDAGHCAECGGLFDTKQFPFMIYFGCEERINYAHLPDNPNWPVRKGDKIYVHDRCLSNKWHDINACLKRCAQQRQIWLSVWGKASRAAKVESGQLNAIVRDLHEQEKHVKWSRKRTNYELTCLYDIVVDYAYEFGEELDKYGKFLKPRLKQQIDARTYGAHNKKFTVWWEHTATANDIPKEEPKIKTVTSRKRKATEATVVPIPKKIKLAETIVIHHKDMKNYVDVVWISKNWRWLPKSEWFNPYEFTKGKMNATQTADAMERYEGYVRRYKISKLHQLKGKALACWCSPGPCHGDVLVKLVKEFCP